MNKIHHTHTNDKFKNQWGFIGLHRQFCRYGKYLALSLSDRRIWRIRFSDPLHYICGADRLHRKVIGEMAFGRAMQTGPLSAFTKAFEQRGHKKLGETHRADPCHRFSRNCDRIQRCSRLDHPLLCTSITGSLITTPDSGADFGALAQNFGSIPWHLSGLVLVLLCTLIRNLRRH